MLSLLHNSSSLYSKLQNEPYCILARFFFFFFFSGIKHFAAGEKSIKILLFKLMTVLNRTLQTQSFNPQFLFLNGPQYLSFLKLKQLFQGEGRGGEGSKHLGISIFLSMPTYLVTSTRLFLKLKGTSLDGSLNKNP